jgi:RNA polymerase sigma factor (TIGR02999 family)
MWQNYRVIPGEMDPDGLNKLVEALYGDLHRIAESHLRKERADHTLQATALLHEAYVKLSGGAQSQFSDRTHFLATASRVMRQVLVDHARARLADKRGSGKVTGLEGSETSPGLQIAAGGNTKPVEILELNRAIEALSQEDPGLAQLIELRYFGGMSAEETAEALGRSVHAVRYDLRLAHAWLRRKLSQGQR